MTTTFIGILITALAIEIDKLTRFQYRGLPLLALAGVVTILFSLVM